MKPWRIFPPKHEAVNIETLTHANWLAGTTIAAIVLINIFVFTLMSNHQAHRFKIVEASIQQQNLTENIAADARYFFAELRRDKLDTYLLAKIQDQLTKKLDKLQQIRNKNEELIQRAFILDKPQTYSFYYDPPYHLARQLNNFESYVMILTQHSPEIIKKRYIRWNALNLIVSQNSSLMRGMSLYLKSIINRSDEFSQLMKNVSLAFNAILLLTLAIQLQFIFKPIFNRLKEEQIQLGQYQIQLKELATQDPLTGLINRYELEERVQILIENSTPQNRFTLLMIDLDKFKPINDSYGHDVGDYVLKTISTRIKQFLDEADFAARIGGDEFIICLNDITLEQDLSTTIGVLEEVIEDPIDIEHLKMCVMVGASIGYANYPVHGQDLNQLFKHADQAMYKVKEAR